MSQIKKMRNWSQGYHTKIQLQSSKTEGVISYLISWWSYKNLPILGIIYSHRSVSIRRGFVDKTAQNYGICSCRALTWQILFSFWLFFKEAERKAARRVNWTLAVIRKTLLILTDRCEHSKAWVKINKIHFRHFPVQSHSRFAYCWWSEQKL